MGAGEDIVGLAVGGIGMGVGRDLTGIGNDRCGDWRHWPGYRREHEGAQRQRLQ